MCIISKDHEWEGCAFVRIALDISKSHGLDALNYGKNAENLIRIINSIE